MGCAGCFKEGKSRREAWSDIAEKSKAFATREQTPMAVYLNTEAQEYKFMRLPDAQALGLDILNVSFPVQ